MTCNVSQYLSKSCIVTRYKERSYDGRSLNPGRFYIGIVDHAVLRDLDLRSVDVTAHPVR
jgi:hypothetical protein